MNTNICNQFTKTEEANYSEVNDRNEPSYVNSKCDYNWLTSIAKFFIKI